MDYLSFDVRIKNLSYCRLGANKEIIQWGISNLNEDPICDVTLRKKCEKQTSYIITGDSTVKYCCTAHSKKFKKKKKLNSSNDIFSISQLCVTKLRELDLNGIQYVLIENQPALKNPIMKSIQMIIYTFFIIDGVMNKDSTINQIHMVNARNKLKVYKGPAVNCPYVNEKKNKYKINKFLSIAYTKKMIENEKEDIQDLFNKSKKKDDLADAYLQGIYWINKSII